MENSLKMVHSLRKPPTFSFAHFFATLKPAQDRGSMSHVRFAEAELRVRETKLNEKIVKATKNSTKVLG